MQPPEEEGGRPRRTDGPPAPDGRSELQPDSTASPGRKWYTALRDDVLDDERLTIHDLAMYVALARRVSARGIVDLTVLALARQARMSQRKAYEALAHLEALGLVRRTRQTGAAGGQRQSRYWLLRRVTKPPQFDNPRDSAPAPHAAPESRDPEILPLHGVQPQDSAPAPHAVSAPRAGLKKRTPTRVGRAAS